MGKFPYKTYLLAVFLLLTPWAAQAAGLGKLTIFSVLGQPLRAEIDLVSVRKDELSSLNVRLASPEAFRQANIEYSAALIGVRMSVERRTDGQPYVKIVSTRAINEPFVDLLVELNWAQGRLLREYTALIDPLDYNPAPIAQPSAATPPVAESLVTPITPAMPAEPAASVPAAAMTPQTPAAGGPEPLPPEPAPAVAAEPQPTTPAMPTEPEASAAQETAPAAAEPPPVAAAPEPEPKSEAAQEYQVKRGDTLSKIANEFKAEGVTTEQILVALFRSNPDAFVGKNMNRLKSGKILRIPAPEELATVSAPDAKKEVRVQATNWNAYRRKLAEAAGETAAQESSATSTGKISTVEAPPPGQTAAKDVLKLSKGETADGKAAPDARVRSLQEDAIAREKALAEANARVAELEKNIKDMQRLLELKGQVPPTLPPALPAPDAATAPEVPATAPTAPAATTPPAEPAVTPEPPKVEAQKPPAPPPEPEPVPEVSLVDEILGDPLYLGAIGGVVVLLGAAGFVISRRRKGGGEGDKPQKPPKKSKDKKAKEATVDPMSQTVALATPPAMAGGDDVDPIAEADLYLNFGRDAQAEEVLKEALEKNPQHEEARLKLLQIYAGRKDKTEFEKVARALYEQTGGSGENWVKAAAMGYALDPANTLYAAGKSAAVPAAAAVAAPLGGGVDLDFDFDLASSSASPTTTQVELDVGSAAAAQKTTIFQPGELTQEIKPNQIMDITHDSGMPGSVAPVPDFTLNVPGAVTEEVDPDITLTPGDDVEKTDLAVGDIAAPANMIDFSFDTPPDTDKVPAGNALSMSADSLPSLAPDFKLDLGGDSSTNIPDLNLGDIKLDLDATAAGSAAGGVKDDRWFDIQTKFDLAKAYQEMGDKDGAREILQEVIKEGDAEQQAEAKTLIESL